MPGSKRRSDRPQAATDAPDQLDQLGVGGGDRVRPSCLVPSAYRTKHPVAAVGVDVLDVGVVEERLQATKPEQQRLDGVHDLVLFGRLQRRLPCGEALLGVSLQGPGQQFGGELAKVGVGQGVSAGAVGAGPLSAQLVGDLLTEAPHQALVDHRASTSADDTAGSAVDAGPSRPAGSAAAKRSTIAPATARADRISNERANLRVDPARPASSAAASASRAITPSTAAPPAGCPRAC